MEISIISFPFLYILKIVLWVTFIWSLKIGNIPSINIKKNIYHQDIFANNALMMNMLMLQNSVEPVPSEVFALMAYYQFKKVNLCISKEASIKNI